MEEEEVIVLDTDSDDGRAAAAPAKRARREAADDGGVEIVAPAPAAMQTEEADDDEDGDDDIRIVGTVGEEALKDFPHPRHACLHYPWAMTVQHKLYCAKCHCYVCDCLASECEEWGDGSRPTDHCHASAEDRAWQLARRARQAAAHAAAAPAPTPAAHGFGAAYFGAPPAPVGLPRPAPRPSVLLPGHVRTPPTAPEQLPDPSTLPGLLHLAHLELLVRATEGHTVAELAAKLGPHGLCVKDNGYNSTAPLPANTPLSLSALLRGSTDYSQSPAVHTPELLEMRPLPRTSGAAATSDTRPSRLLIFQSDGSAPPKEYVVHMAKDAKKRDLLARATALCGADAASEQVVIYQADSRSGTTLSLTGWVAGVQQRGASHYQGGLCYGNSDEALDAKLPSGTRLHGTFPTFVAFRLPVGRFVAVYLRRVGVKKVTHKRARDVRMFGRESELATRLPEGVMALLPMPPSGDGNGGVAAEGELRASLQTFLAPLLKAGAAYAAPATMHHCSITGRFEETAMHYWRASEQEAPYAATKEPSNAYGTLTTELKAQLVRYAAADWTPAALEGSLDIAGMVRPHDQDASAVADRAAELDTLQQEWEDERAAKRAAAVASELRSASEVTWQFHSGAYDPQSQQRSEGSWSRSVPLIRLKLALVPESPTSRDGHLAVDIWALASDGAAVQGVQHCRPLFTSADAGPADRYSGGQGTAAVLKETMNTLLERDSPNHADNQRVWRELEYRHGRDPAITSIPGLLAAVEAQERPEAPQPPGLAVQLRPYQRQALRFMIDAENLEGAGHFWSELPLPADPAAAGGASGSAPAAAQRSVWFSPLMTRLTREESARCAGGMLSAEMGLGKTVISLACVLAAPQSPAVNAKKQAAYAAAVAAAPTAAEKKRVLIPSHATLVVCAVSLVGQWIDEVRNKLSADSALKISMYHGQGRVKDPAELAKYDLVVTTYQTLGSDYTKRGANDLFPPLGAIHWHRVLLDEAHVIKSPKVQQSAACVALAADRRWCCTGTPIGTDVADLFGQFCFLRLSPLDRNNYFETYVKRVYTATGNQYGGSPLPLLYCLSRCMIRHTKAQTLGGAPVLSLPPKTEQDVVVEFSDEERKAYDKTHAEAKKQFQAFRAQGQAMVSQKMLAIMALLLPLRRMASGGALTAKEIAVPDLQAAAAARAAAAVANAIARAAAMAAGGVKTESKPPTSAAAGGAGGSAVPAAMDEDGDACDEAAIEAANAIDAKPILAMENEADEPCGLCGEVPEEPMRTGCGHWFCSDCLLGALPEAKSAAKCPTCQRYVNAAPLHALVAARVGAGGEDEEEEEAEPKPKAKPKAKPKPKAAACARARDSDDEDSAEDTDSDFERSSGGGGATLASTRPRRQAAVTAKARAAAAAASAEAASDEEGGRGGDSDDDDADADASDEAAPKPAAKPAPAKKASAAAKGKAKAKPPAAPVALQSESKLRALLKELQDMREQDETAKALIFSQFNHTLEWLKERLTEEGFGYRTISGSMPLKQRAKSIDAFQKDPPTTVFLLSMRSGAVGINLTAASHVFLMEPVMNPALEAQAIGRAWRMGQLRPVTVYKLYVKDSVEQRIRELVQLRASSAGAGETSSAFEALRAQKGKQKILVSEIAGAIRDDRQALRLNELDLLFS